MNDLAKWEVHGPVSWLKRSFAEWDLSSGAWNPSCVETEVWFNTNGALVRAEHHNGDGTSSRSEYRYDESGRLLEVCWNAKSGSVVSRNEYDDAGRHIRTVSIDAVGSARLIESITYDGLGERIVTRHLNSTQSNVHYSIPGAEVSVSAPGAITMSLFYPPEGGPTTVRFADAEQNVVQHVALSNNGKGQLVRIEFGDGEQGTESPMRSVAAGHPELAAAIAQLFPTHTFNVEYNYDDRGRRIECVQSMGLLGEEHTKYLYAEGDDPVEGIYERHNREAAVGPEGMLKFVNENVTTQRSRFDYEYDAQGNWTKRVVSIRGDFDSEFRFSNMSLRELLYHA